MRFPGASLASSEVYAMRGFKGPVGKPPREAVHEIGENLLMYIDNTKQPTILTI